MYKFLQLLLFTPEEFEGEEFGKAKAEDQELGTCTQPGEAASKPSVQSEDSGAKIQNTESLSNRSRTSPERMKNA